MKQFLSHLSLLMLLNLLVKPAYLLVVDARIQDVLGPEEFGRYFPLLSLGILFNILLDVGLSNHMTRLIASKPNEWQASYSAGWKAKGLLIPLYFMALMGTGWALGYQGQSLQWLAWVGLNQALLSSVLFVRAGLQGLGAHRTDAWVSVLDRSLMLLGLGIVLAIQPGFQIIWLLAGTSIALGITGGIAFWRLQINRFPEHIGTDSASNVWIQLRESWPYALLFLLMMTYHRIDAIMLERMAVDGAKEAGWYAMSYRLFEAANMIGYLFATLLLPYFSRMLATKIDIRPLAIGASQILLVGGGAIGWTACFWPEELLQIFYDREIQQAAPILPWLMVSFAIFAQGYVFSTLLTARKDLKFLNWVAAFGAFGNIVLNVIWIPKFGALGCAMASAFTQATVVLVQCLATIFKHPGSVWWGLARSLLLHSLCCAAICFVGMRFAFDAGWIVPAVIAACLLSGFTPGIMDDSALRALLSDKMNTFTPSKFKSDS
jgi:O-antigen/teichoic acid export membrane protein